MKSTEYWLIYLEMLAVSRWNIVCSTPSACLTVLRIRAAKGKGEIDMYFVSRINRELSKDDITLNEKFEELYRRLAEVRK